MSSPSVNYRTFVIANPIAAAGNVKDEWPLIERLLRANLPELDYAFTDGPGHATLLTREALRAGWEMVVSVGGDGTLNEVLNGFYDRPKAQEDFSISERGFVCAENSTPTPVNPDAVLGVIPMGTGGDFRRTLGLMGGIAETVDRLRGRHTRAIDLGQVAYLNHKDKLASHYFLNIAAAGLSGLVDHYVNRSWKGLGGTTSFAIGTLRAGIKWKNAQMAVVLDGTTEIDDMLQNVIVANGAYFGGGMWIAPGALVDDGQFEVILMRDLSFRESLVILPQIYSGKHLSSRKVTRHQAEQIAVRAVGEDRDILLDIDGEQPGKLPALWKMHRGALKFKV